MCFQVFSGVCKCFRCILQVFQLFRRRIFQVFNLDVAKIDIVLHILQYIGPTYCRRLLQLLGHRRVGTDSSTCMCVGSGEGRNGPHVRLGYVGDIRAT
jgi:hypothetical protein